MDKVENRTLPLAIKKLFEDHPSLGQILHNIQQVVWLLDLRTGDILYVSPSFETVWGRTRESLYADPLTLIKNVHPEDRVKVMSASPDDIRKGMDQSYRIIRPDGSLRWISAHTFLFHGESSDVSYQICIAQDITEQNQLDRTLRKALDRSHEQFTLSQRMSLARKPEAVLKTLMSASELRPAKRAFILFFDSPMDGLSHEIEVITSWPSASNQTDLHSNEQASQTSLFEDLASLELFHPSRPVIVSEISKDQRLTPAVRDLLVEAQIETIAIFPLVALGNWLGCLLVFFPTEKHFEPIELRHIKVLVDQATITLYNLQLLEIEAESRHEAERANEIKTRFLAMISHELRTPLTSIRGFTTTLLAEDVVWDPEEQRDFIQTIEEEANQLQELIDHLLDLSRLEAGRLPVVMESHTLQEIIQGVLPQFQVMTQKHVLTLRLPPDLPPVFVDAKRIAQVLVNLVQNASKYSPEATEIILAASVRGSFVNVSVSNQGPGIPPADRKRVFQAFQRGIHEDDSGSKGAGLGLAICKGLVEAHGGRIWIKRQTDPGTTITFTIPLVPQKTSAIAPEKA